MFRFASKTHAGYRDGENQDAVGCDPKHALWFIADGLGGQAAGSVASDVVKATLLELIDTAPLDQAILCAHGAILRNVEEEPAHAGMGSTVVAAKLIGAQCTIMWVGDSRAYLWRQGQLSALTRDHTLVEELRESQGLTDEQVRSYPDRGKLTLALGLKVDPVARMQSRLRAGDQVLLCSDGLTDELTDEAISGLLRSHPVTEEACDALIAAALEHGGKDNMSVVLVAYNGRGKGEPMTPLTPRTIMVLSILIGVAAAIVVAWVSWLLFARHQRGV